MGPSLHQAAVTPNRAELRASRFERRRQDARRSMTRFVVPPLLELVEEHTETRGMLLFNGISSRREPSRRTALGLPIFQDDSTESC